MNMSSSDSGTDTTSIFRRVASRINSPHTCSRARNKVSGNCCLCASPAIRRRLHPGPGSSAIEFSVLVRAEGNERRFTMAFIKRYDREGLAECLSSLGWEPIEIWDREVGNSLLGLFRWRG